MNERQRRARTQAKTTPDPIEAPFDTEPEETEEIGEETSSELAALDISEKMLRAYESYGQEESTGGSFGRFTKAGVWEFGTDQEVPGEYEVFAVDMATAARGWICWVNATVADEIMYPISSDRSVRRSELADHSPRDGYAQGDGWSEQSSFKIKSLATNEQILVKGSSLGFRNMASRLCKDFASRIREQGTRASLVPLVILDGSHYLHKKYGRIAVPLMHTVDWSSHAELMEDMPAKKMKRLVTQAKAIKEERRSATARSGRR